MPVNNLENTNPDLLPLEDVISEEEQRRRSELALDLKDKLIKLLRPNGVKVDFAFQDRLMHFAQRILNKHSDAREYQLFHLIMNSTPQNGDLTDLPKFDFPGGYSIENFLNRYIDKQKN